MKHADLAWLSAAIYESRVEFERRCALRGFEVVDYFDYRGTQAALVTDLDDAAIVFRGTQFGALKWRDIWSNLSWPWATVWQGPGRVHSGYRRHLNMVGHQAMEMAKIVSRDRKLKVTGQSMGGSLATVFASWYYHGNLKPERKSEWTLAELVTFGAPPALDGEALRWIKCRKTRYAVRGDPAPYWKAAVGLGHPSPPLRLEPRSPWDGPLARHDAWGYATLIGAKNL